MLLAHINNEELNEELCMLHKASISETKRDIDPVGGLELPSIINVYHWKVSKHLLMVKLTNKKG